MRSALDLDLDLVRPGFPALASGFVFLTIGEIERLVTALDAAIARCDTLARRFIAPGENPIGLRIAWDDLDHMTAS